MNSNVNVFAIQLFAIVLSFSLSYSFFQLRGEAINPNSVHEMAIGLNGGNNCQLIESIYGGTKFQ